MYKHVACAMARGSVVQRTQGPAMNDPCGPRESDTRVEESDIPLVLRLRALMVCHVPHSRTFQSRLVYMSLPCHYFLVNQHLLTLVRETDIMRTIALRKSPPDSCRGGRTSVPRLEHSICRDAEVPSSTQSAPYLPLGLIRMRIEQIRESPLGLDPRAAELPICIPTWYAQYPKRQGDLSPHTPSPLAGLLMAPLSVSSRGGSRPLNRWGQAASQFTVSSR